MRIDSVLINPMIDFCQSNTIVTFVMLLFFWKKLRECLTKKAFKTLLSQKL